MGTKKPAKRRTARTARTPADRVFVRDQGGCARYWLDLRDLGAGRVALCVPGERRATTDFGTALSLAEVRVAEAVKAQQEAARFNVQARVLGLDGAATLGAFADRHLAKEEASGRRSARWLDYARGLLARAVLFFDAVQPAADPAAWKARGMPDGPRLLGSISTPDVAQYIAWLATVKTTRGKPFGPQSRLHHLSALSRLFRRAVSEGSCQRNPCSDLLDRPTAPQSSTKSYEPREVALILEAARLHQAENGGNVHAVLAVLAYTGARFGEVRNLLIQDVRAGLSMGVLDVSADADRSVKTRTSVRTIPLAPAMAEILDSYCRTQHRLAGRLFQREDGRPLGDIRKTLAAVARRAGLGRTEIRPKRFRTTYATWRPTVDGVTLLDVQHELGHADLSMIARVYGRTRLTRTAMGAHLDYSAGRWLDAEHFATLENAGGPSVEEADRRRERAAVVRAFLASVDGMGAKEAGRASGVDRNAIHRLRSGASSPENMKGRTLERMREHLARVSARLAA